jgi:hypothetical protein
VTRAPNRAPSAALAIYAVSALLGASSAKAETPATSRELDAAASALELDAALETGAEYDSNIHRIERGHADDPCRAVRGAPVARAGARLSGIWRRVPGETLALSGFGGAKVFGDREGQRENAAIGRGEASYHKLAGSAIAGVRAAYYDTSGFALADPGPDCDGLLTSRNIGLASASAEVMVPGPRDYRVRAYGGGRLFRYRADRDFDWAGDHYGIELARGVWTRDPDRDASAAHLDARVGYRLERRGYRGVALTNICPDASEPDPSCFVPSGLTRSDVHHALGGEAVYTGERMYSARYELEVHDSNSDGHSLLRQRLELGVTAELPWQLLVTAEGALLLDIYLDSLLLARDAYAQSFVSIDDENRNRLALHVARPLGDRLAAELRYSLSSNELSGRDFAFRRQTLYLGAVYRLAD